MEDFNFSEEIFDILYQHDLRVGSAYSHLDDKDDLDIVCSLPKPKYRSVDDE